MAPKILFLFVYLAVGCNKSYRQYFKLDVRATTFTSVTQNIAQFKKNHLTFTQR